MRNLGIVVWSMALVSTVLVVVDLVVTLTGGATYLYLTIPTFLFACILLTIFIFADLLKSWDDDH